MTRTRSLHLHRAPLVWGATLAILSMAPAGLSGGTYQVMHSHGKVVLITEGRPEGQPISYRPAWTVPMASSDEEVHQAIQWYARRYRLLPALLQAVIQAESEFDPIAVSRAGALGLMQLMPDTAASLRVKDPFNPVENIRGGAKHLRRLLDRFNGDLPLALAAYNAGEYRVRRHRGIPPIEETRLYVKKVLAYYALFRTEARRPATGDGAKGLTLPPSVWQ